VTDWVEHWEAYLEKKFNGSIPDGAIQIDLGEIDFYIPPLLGTTADSYKAICKHNSKIGIF
jgi:hypothetical protein